MNHYDFPAEFRNVYDKSVAAYSSGLRDPKTWFTADEQAFLTESGIGLQAMLDYAEDHINYGEPGYDRALEIETVRRDYFLNVQQGNPSSVVLDAGKMPAKTEAVKDISWLPRLLPKAKAKLRGELPSSLMYSCGGDREFFKKHDILPAEFLTLVWRNGDNDAATVDWVVARSAAAS